ncbi:MAG: AbrB/MazE/SpoVT family DNA-binding domain-containing protein [Gammaproteobacteria bacterium]|nr:AbrB/MazE/SpoVT family DNA-binding domain-containing protein [Gammaproteobacteria bacterium]
MIKTLQRHGNSQALVLDKPILEMLGAGEDTPLQLSVSGGSLIVTPVNTGVGRDGIDRAFEDLQPRYGDMLRRLAE